MTNDSTPPASHTASDSESGPVPDADSGSEPAPPPPTPHSEGGAEAGRLPRRDFLRVAGAGAGLLLVGGAGIGGPETIPGVRPRASVRSASASPDVVVIGAGAWGSFTALNLRQMGA